MKNRILDATARELNARGIKFTVNAVSTRLGISKKTLYLHFPSKDALIAGVIDAILTDIANQRKTILSKDMTLAERLTAILTIKPARFSELKESMLGDIRLHYPAEWVKIEKFHCQQLAILLDLLDKGKSTGDIRRINSHIAAGMLISAVGQLLEGDFLTRQNLTIADALKEITDLFLNGVLAKPNSQYGGAA